MSYYDRDLDTHDTAVRAVWVLYRRRRWDLLAEVGITRNHATELEAATLDFDKRLTDGQVESFCRDCPFVRGAAINIQILYRLICGGARYYEDYPSQS